ncbi:DNA translocase FtsK [uncultured Amnibacterium sp.]|uniref:DNA translocase FtsK n=1 Tax=uncultured Amnibacterium sp. TaxID=1631851 RepID=UPI0035CAC057
MPSEPSIARPAIAALVLLAAVALTGVVLYYWWPGGVLIGVGVGAGAVLVAGVQMQRSNARVPSDEALVRRLGVPVQQRAQVAALLAAPAQAQAPAQAAPAPARAVVVPAVVPLPARDDDAWFSADAAPALKREPVVVPAAEPVAVDDGPDTIPTTDFVLTDDAAVRTDLEHLKDELGEDYLDFARAARLVVSTQYASAARLQRDLDVPYSRARRLLTDLEQQHFVGPATGSLPRVVLMPKDRLPEVERLLEEV